MFDPRRVYSNDRRFSHKAQIIQKRPITSEQNARRPVAASDLERAKVVMDSFGYVWYTYPPVLRCKFRPKGNLQPVYVAPYDPFVHSSTWDYWITDNPEFYKGIYQTVIFIAARNVYFTYGNNLDMELAVLLEDYYCQIEASSLPGYGQFIGRVKRQNDANFINANLMCPYTDTSHLLYRLCQSSTSDDYPSELEVVCIA